MKYNFYTGKDAKKVKYKGYKYLGKGKLGKLKIEKIDGKNFYYLIDFFNDFSKVSPKTADKTKFKKIEIEDLEFKEEYWDSDNYIEKQKSKSELIFRTKIIQPKDKIFFNSPKIKLGNHDNIHFFKLDESNIIKDLQLKNGDKLIIKIKKK